MLSYLKFIIDPAKNLFEAGLKLSMEFKEVFSNLENPETKELIGKIERAVSSNYVICFSYCLFGDVFQAMVNRGNAEKNPSSPT